MTSIWYSFVINKNKFMLKTTVYQLKSRLNVYSSFHRFHLIQCSSSNCLLDAGSVIFDTIVNPYFSVNFAEHQSKLFGTRTEKLHRTLLLLKLSRMLQLMLEISTPSPKFVPCNNQNPYKMSDDAKRFGCGAYTSSQT